MPLRGVACRGPSPLPTCPYAHHGCSNPGKEGEAGRRRRLGRASAAFVPHAQRPPSGPPRPATVPFTNQAQPCEPLWSLQVRPRAPACLQHDSRRRATAACRSSSSAALQNMARELVAAPQRRSSVGRLHRRRPCCGPAAGGLLPLQLSDGSSVGSRGGSSRPRQSMCPACNHTPASSAPAQRRLCHRRRAAATLPAAPCPLCQAEKERTPQPWWPLRRPRRRRSPSTPAWLW